MTEDKKMSVTSDSERSVDDKGSAKPKEDAPPTEEEGVRRRVQADKDASETKQPKAQTSLEEYVMQ